MTTFVQRAASLARLAMVAVLRLPAASLRRRVPPTSQLAKELANPISSLISVPF
jgi:hypothetical protein